MKKIVILSTLLLFCRTLSAQYQKGDRQLSVGYTADFTPSNLYRNLDGMKENTYGYRTAAGIEYFLSDRFSLGAAPFWQEIDYHFEGVFRQSVEGEPMRLSDEYDYDVRSVGFDLSGKYYRPVARNLYLTVRGFASMSWRRLRTRQTFTAEWQPAERPGGLYTDDKDSKVGYADSDRASALFLGLTPGLTYTCNRFSVNLEVLPLTVGFGGRSKGLGVRTEPYAGSDGRICFSEYDAAPV